MASLPQDRVVAFPERVPAPPVQLPARQSLPRRLLAEPLTHFIVLGALIFALVHVIESRSARHTIRLGPDELQRLATTYEQQYGAAPDAAQMRVLVQDRIRQDIFYREAQALGLDREDEVVRRRIAQKYEFLMQDNVVPRAPDEAELRRYYEAHRRAYALPARRTFEQAYFAIDERGEAAAKALAQAAADGARRGEGVPAGDPFPGPQSIRLLSQADIGRLFGDDAFAAAVLAAPQGAWIGPLRSGFGWHVLRVTEAQPGEPRSFADARDAVLHDWSAADRNSQNEAAYARLREGYRIEVGQ